MGMFEYEQQLADLGDKYHQNRAAQEFGRFLSQQRFNRQRWDLNEGFKRQFPKVTGGLAARFGGNVRSGQVGKVLNQAVGGFQNTMGDLNTEQAANEANFVSQASLGEASYRQAVLRLMEQIAAERARQNPFAQAGV